MGRGSRFLFVTFFTDNRILDELKAFTAEISGIIEKHYHFTFDVEFGDMFSFADMKEAARVFWIISYRYSPKDVASLEDVLADYRDMGEDNFTAYVSDSLIGKSWKRLHKEKRSLEGFASIEDLKLQLYYDFCTYTEIGGMKIAEGCRKGQIKLAEQPLKTLDPSGVAVFSNPEIKETRETLESQTAKYRELKEQYREKKGETEFFKEYGKAAEDCFETSRKLSRMERQVQDIMDANADFRKWGLQSPMYRVAYALFRQGKFGEAYHALTTKAMYDFDVTGGTGRNWYSECVAATSFLKMKLLQLLPDGYVEPGKKKAPDLMMETASLLENVYWYAKRSPKMYGLVYMRMTFKRRNKRSMFDISFPEDMKEAISKLKKDKGDTRFMEFRFRYALSDYYISDEDYRKINGRSIKSNLDAALKLAQDLSKEYGGLYDMFVGDTYVTYSVYCANKDDIEGMRDMLFASADRYKSAMAANPDDPEPCHRLAESYRTLALSYGREGQLDYCREYFAKSVERYEALKKLDKVTALNCLAELYEDYADIVKPAAAAPGAVSDVSEPEDILLAAIRCRKELAEMSPFEHQTDVGVIYDTLGSLFSEAGMYDEGMDYYRSAAEEYKMCARAFGEKFQPLLAKCYCNMFMAPQAKDVDEAIRCLMWAVTCFDEAQKKDPSFFLPELANAWRCLAHAQLMAGRYEDAISSHIAAIDKYTQADDVCDPEMGSFVESEAMEYSRIAQIYDKLKVQKDEEAEAEGSDAAGEDAAEKKRAKAAASAEMYHLKGIGVAYIGNEGIEPMEDTLTAITRTYITSLMHPGYNALAALIYHYLSNTTPDNLEELADNVSDLSDSHPDMAEEDKRVLQHILETQARLEMSSKTDEEDLVPLLGAYYAAYSQYLSMDNEKEAKKQLRKAKKFFEEEFAPDPEDEDWDDGSYDGDDLDTGSIKEILGTELYNQIMNIFNGDKPIPQEILDADFNDLMNMRGPDAKGFGYAKGAKGGKAAGDGESEQERQERIERRMKELEEEDRAFLEKAKHDDGYDDSWMDDMTDKELEALMNEPLEDPLDRFLDGDNKPADYMEDDETDIVRSLFKEMFPSPSRRKPRENGKSRSQDEGPFDPDTDDTDPGEL